MLPYRVVEFRIRQLVSLITVVEHIIGDRKLPGYMITSLLWLQLEQPNLLAEVEFLNRFYDDLGITSEDIHEHDLQKQSTKRCRAELTQTMINRSLEQDMLIEEFGEGFAIIDETLENLLRRLMNH